MPYRPDDPHQKVFQLPPGQHCSVGLADNMAVTKDGDQAPGSRLNEDKYFTCSAQNDKLQVYMVLDGHDGAMACEFAQKHLPLILLDCGIRDEASLAWALKRSFNKTEEDFFKRIDGHISRRMAVQFEIDQKATNSKEAAKLCPGLVEQLGRLDDEIRGGTTAVVATVYGNRLFVANCGDSRAVLCCDDASGKLVTNQLSVDHNTSDEGEIQRLAVIGLDPHRLRESKRLGTQQNTRSIGDYFIKGGYQNVDAISHALREPGTAEPFVSGAVDLTYFNGFLILMSDGLYKAYESWTRRPSQVNEDIGYLVAMEIKQNPEFHLVAQNVVQKVINVYKKFCKKEMRGGKLDDITLIVRNFGYPFTHSNVRSSAYHHNPSAVPSTAPAITGPGRNSDRFFPIQESPYPYVIPEHQPVQEFSNIPTHQQGVMRQHGYSSSVPQSGGGHFQPEPDQILQQKDWPAYSYQTRPEPNPPPLTTVQSYPHMTLPHNRGRQQSIPADNAHVLDDRAYHTLQSRSRRKDYENTNPQRTDQRHLAEIETRTQALQVHDQESQVTERSANLESSPNSAQQPPALRTPVHQPPVSRTPVKQPSPPQPPPAADIPPQDSVDPNEDDLNYELYGWRISDRKKSEGSIEQPQDDTIKEGEKNNPPANEENGAEAESDEETLYVDPNDTMDFVPPVEDVTDGEAKCYVKFSENFPNLNWDDIVLED